MNQLAKRKKARLKLTESMVLTGITSTKELCKTVGVAERTMEDYLYELGVQRLPEKSRIYAERMAYVKEHFTETVEDIAGILGISKARVYEYIKDIEYTTGMKRPRKTPLKVKNRYPRSDCDKLQYKTAQRAHKLFTARLSA